MRKVLGATILFFLSSTAFAYKTPSQVVAGAAVNYWTQGGLRVTDKPFDLGIQGNGFFVLRLPNGDQGFSRCGEMSLDADGFLVHSLTKGRVLGNCDGEVVPINIGQFAYEADGSVAKSFRVELDGVITAAYEDGYSRSICRVALAVFQNPTTLKLSSNHLLQETVDSGKPFIGEPHVAGRGSIYSASLEELDDQMYRLNLKTSDKDRVLVEMDKQRTANEAWIKQKTLFYIYDLGVSRDELACIDASLERCSKEIQKIVVKAETAVSEISSDTFASEIKVVLDRHENEILDILGSERLEAAKKFRYKFNEDVWVRFGTSLRFTAF